MAQYELKLHICSSLTILPDSVASLAANTDTVQRNLLSCPVHIFELIVLKSNPFWFLLLTISCRECTAYILTGINPAHPAICAIYPNTTRVLPRHIVLLSTRCCPSGLADSHTPAILDYKWKLQLPVLVRNLAATSVVNEQCQHPSRTCRMSPREYYPLQ